MNSKKLKIMIAMIVVALALILGFLLVGSNSRAVKKQITLGQKYLAELNYEQAIATFKHAIELDPYDVEAYLGLAEAYVRLEDYDSAKAILEKGIQVLTEAGKEEKISGLKDKLQEVQSTIDKILEEEVRLKAEEEARLKAEEEARLKAEAEANMIKLQPIWDFTNNIWGKNLLGWTLDDYINEFNLIYDGELDEWIDEDSNRFCWDESMWDIEGSYVLFEGNDQLAKTGMGTSYYKVIRQDNYQPVKDDLYDFVMGNHLDSIAGVLEYLRLDPAIFSSDDMDYTAVPITTDMGEVNVYHVSGEDFETLSIEIVPEEQQMISFVSDDGGTYGEPSYHVDFDVR